MGILDSLFKSKRAPAYRSLPPSLFPTGEHSTSTSAWADSIQDLEEGDECRLRRIVHCKATSGSRDEFLLIHIRHPCGKVAIVFASRDTTFDVPSASASCDDEGTSPPYSATAARVLGVAPCRDRVRLSLEGTVASLTHHVRGGWSEIHTVRFGVPRDAPSVAHLAVLLTVVHRHGMSPDVSVEMRSGWFAYSVAEAMKEIFWGSSCPPNESWVRVPYGGMAVESRDTVIALVREFTPEWDRFLRARGSARQAEPKPKHQEGKKAKKRAQMDSFVHMLRTMEP